MFFKIARLYGKNEFSDHELMKNKEKYMLDFLLHRKLQNMLL